ncbi:MAG: CHAT domain-containing protein [Planctomycetaceae bacterium]|nr:CHAT domain-containing protein [Planctomycetaceae bacterium]
MLRRAAAVCTILLLASNSATAQLGRMLDEAPSRHYINITLPAFYQGDFNDTLNYLNNDLRNAVKIPLRDQGTFLWLDSMCYWALQGECHFQMARYDDALRSFNTALQIYFEQSDWLRSITTTVQPSMEPRTPLPWGQSTRAGNVGNFSNCRFQMSHEHLRVVPAGEGNIGLAAQRTLSTVHADHIIQCLALTIRRRAEILGSLSKYDPDTQRLAQILAARPHLPNHFAGTWVDVLHGLALSALGDNISAETHLSRGLLMMNAFDHHLTPVALNELGNLAIRNGNAEAARMYYLEASYSAYQMGDPVLLGETFRNMANAHRLIQKSQPFPPIVDASNYLRSQRNVSPMTLIPVLHEEAEYYITLRRLPEAATVNNLSASVMRSTRNGVLFNTAHGARYNYLAAMIVYAGIYSDLLAGRNVPDRVLASGNTHLENSLGFLRWGTPRLYQLNKLEEFFHSGMITVRGPITERVADELYDELLRESSELDWALHPMDSFAALVATPPGAYERWFAVALQRGNRDKAFDISERARHARFFANLPLAESRLMAFRLLFESDEGTLTPEMLLQRQTLSLEFPDFSQLSDNVRNIRRQLVNIPIVPQNPDQLASQRALFADLERHSLVQESALRMMALSRTRVPAMFPPTMPLEQIRRELPENTAMLTFTESLGLVFGFLIDRQSMTVWQVQAESPRDKPLHTLITDYLRDLGNAAPGQAVGTRELEQADGKWKESGAELLRRLLGNQMRPGNFTELVIVPTGPLWYVPFEAMSVPSGDQLRPLLTAGQTPLSIRYAPTAALGVPNQPSWRSATAETLIICGKLTPRDAIDVSLDAVNRFSQAGIRNVSVLRTDERNAPLPASPSAFASQIQQLVVLDDIPMAAPLGWSPFTTRSRVPIASWLTLPWGGPRLVVLPAFHTAAENSLRTGVQNGDDLFLLAMLLEASGARSILISRWRTGGRASYDLVEQFLAQLSQRPAVEAWRQAILEVGSEPINLDEEPRVRRDANMESVPIANHPFFWGAFMLIDRGERPE